MMKRYGLTDRRKIAVGIAAAILVIVALALLLYFIEYRSRKREDISDSGRWGNVSSNIELVIDDKSYVSSDDIDAYLFIGTDGNGGREDQSIGYNGSMADFLTLLIINRTKEQYGFLQLDRDTITEVPELAEDGSEIGVVYEQLCIAHWYGYTEEQRNENTVTAVSRFLGNLPIRGYYTINMDDIAVLNHAIGGVTVTIDEDMTSVDPAMKKGTEIHLGDDQVEGYLRARMSVGDGTNVARMGRQRQYMQKVYSIILTNFNKDPEYINDLYKEVQSVVDSNMPGNEISRIANGIKKMENLGILTIDGTNAVGNILEDDEPHAEFYAKPDSIVEQLGKLLTFE